MLVLLCAAAAGLAQEAIEWSLERRLTREDFNGRVPASASTASMSWIHIETEWECKDGTLTAMARATFDPSRSWFRTVAEPAMELDIQLLEHEQIHFDIAEVAVRKIRASFQTFTSACAEAGGTDPIRARSSRAPIAICRKSRNASTARPHTASTRASRRSGSGGYGRF